MRADIKNGAFEARRQGEIIRIEAWGPNALRVRTTRYPHMSGADWALTEPTEACELDISHEVREP